VLVVSAAAIDGRRGTVGRDVLIRAAPGVIAPVRRAIVDQRRADTGTQGGAAGGHAWLDDDRQLPCPLRDDVCSTNGRIEMQVAAACDVELAGAGDQDLVQVRERAGVERRVARRIVDQQLRVEAVRRQVVGQRRLAREGRQPARGLRRVRLQPGHDRIGIGRVKRVVPEQPPGPGLTLCVLH
jgi:hypothetical protein